MAIKLCNKLLFLTEQQKAMSASDAKQKAKNKHFSKASQAKLPNLPIRVALFPNSNFSLI